MPKTILPTGQGCLREGWYITAVSKRCHCEMRQILKVGQKAPACPRCDRSVDWVLIESRPGRRE